MSKVKVNFDVDVNEKEIKDLITKNVNDRYTDAELPKGVTKQMIIDKVLRDDLQRISLAQGINHLYKTFGNYEKITSSLGQDYYIHTPGVESGNPFNILIHYSNKAGMINTCTVPIAVLNVLKAIAEDGGKGSIRLGTGHETPNNERDKFINHLLKQRVLKGKRTVTNVNGEPRAIYDKLNIPMFGQLINIGIPSGVMTDIWTIRFNKGYITVWDMLFSANEHNFQNITKIHLVPEVVDALVKYYNKVLKEISEKEKVQADDVDLLIKQHEDAIKLLKKQKQDKPKS